MVRVTGDVQHLRQFPLFAQQQAIALRNPDRQAPDIYQCLAEFEQAYPEQFFLDLMGWLPLVDNPQLPVFQQLWITQRQRPQGGQEQ
ncbi:hypothetical protein D3C80_2065680 [compost metagenome]